MKKLLKIALTLVIVAALAMLGIKAVKKKRAQDASLPPAKIYPIVVKTIKPKSSEITLTLPYLAESYNETDLSIASRISARVAMIKKSGDEVKKGETVVKLDTTDITAKIESAKISLDNLKKAHDRTLALYKVKGASIEQLQKEESSIAKLESNLKELNNQMSYANLTSPVDGIVAKSFATEGSIALPGKALLNISAREGFSLLVRTPNDIKPLTLLYRGKSYDLHSLESSWHGLDEYKAYVNNAGLKSGDRVEVNVAIYRGRGVLLPFDAVLNRDGKSYVLATKGNKAYAKEIKVVQNGQEGIAAEQLPKEGDIIIAKPDVLLKLLSGYTLKIKE